MPIKFGSLKGSGFSHNSVRSDDLDKRMRIAQAQEHALKQRLKHGKVRLTVAPITMRLADDERDSGT